MKHRELNAYFELLESFKSGRINAECFEVDFLVLFKSDQQCSTMLFRACVRNLEQIIFRCGHVCFKFSDKRER
jgi:hypothetical protein